MLIVSNTVYARWSYDKKLDGIYSIYKTKDDAGWNVYVILLVKKDEVSFTSTVPFEEYKKIFTEETNTKTDGFVLNWQYLEGCGINVPKEYRWSKEKYVARFRSTEPIEKQ